jgi:hypothetical protein
MSIRTIRLVDVERGDLLQIIGHRRSYPVIGLDRVRDSVTLDFYEYTETFDAKDVIGHLREYKPKCYRLMWSRNIGLTEAAKSVCSYRSIDWKPDNQGGR